MSVQCFQCKIIKKNNPLKDIYTTNSAKLLGKHISLRHPYTTVFNCTYCPAKTNDKQVYVRHVNRHLSRGNIELLNEITPQGNNPQNINEDVDNPIPLDEPDNQLELLNDNDQIVDINKYSDEIEAGACRFVLQILRNSDTTMKKTLKIINTVDYFVTPMYNFIALNINSIECNGDKEKFLELCKNPFKNLRTEHRLLSYLASKNLYSNPSKYILKRTMQYKTRKGVTTIESVDEFLVLMSVKYMIKEFLECPGIYEKMMNKMRSLLQDEQNIHNFVQGQKWRKILMENPGKILIPIFLYNDDFAVGNQQGIKASNHGLSVVNFHFPLLEDWELSKLEFLFPAAFVKASYTKGGRKSLCLIKLRNILKEMAEDGIELTINNEKIRVYIILGAIIGDNLAVHQMLDFSSGFMHEYMCRVCLMDKDTRYKAVIDNPELYRSKEHYDEHKNNSRYGYNRSCPFNLIPSFHVIRNYSVDLMHDLFEGVAVYGMQAALDTLIREKYFTSDEFSKMLDTFSYGEIDSRNKLSSDNFKNNKLFLTASQSMLLVKYITVLICHRVPKTNSTFKYLIVLEKLCNLCMCKYFNENRLNELTKLIKKHHSLYLKFKVVTIDPVTGIVTENFLKLKPKHHIILHYVLCIRQNGPLVYMWTMRHEGLNKYMKMYTYASTSRVNLSFSLAKRFQLLFSCFLIKYNEIKNVAEIEFSKSFKYDFELKEYKESINFPFPIESIKASYKKIAFRGTEYKIDYFVLSFNTCCKIIDIISTLNNNYFVILKEYNYEEKESLNYCLLKKEKENFHIRTINFLGMPFNITTLKNKQKIFKLNKYRIMYK